MTRSWTCYWQFRYWRSDINSEYKPTRSSGSNLFRKRGVSIGDTVYIISQGAGQLYIGGRMTVKQILSRDEAVQLWDSDSLYDATEWIVDPSESGTLLHLHRRLTPLLTKQIRFKTKQGPKEPFFTSETELDKQAIRNVRELTQESAALFDQIIAVTDRMPRSEQVINVTEKMLRADSVVDEGNEFRLPEEIASGGVYSEGGVKKIEVNRYERDPRVRMECIAVHGTNCCVCGFNFGTVYGQVAAGYIHVHHLKLLSGGERVVDPVEDLRPVCPNCHAVLHLGGVCRTIDEVREMLSRETI